MKKQNKTETGSQIEKTNWLLVGVGGAGLVGSVKQMKAIKRYALPVIKQGKSWGCNVQQ